MIDIPAEIAGHEPWFNQTLAAVNDSVARLGILEGDFHWHRHEAEDEFFVVLEGTAPDRPGGRADRHASAAPGLRGAAGVVHRTRAPERTAVLMVEPAGVVPTGAG